MSKRNRRKLRFTPKRNALRIAVLTPCHDMVHTEFAISMLQMFQYTQSKAPKELESLTMSMLGNSCLPKGRQNLCDKALEQGSTHILWIDSDMKFPADMCLRLMGYTEPIVGINAMARRSPFQNCAQHEDGSEVITTRESTGLEKVGRMGFGVLWLDVRVFAEMKKPYFDFQYIDDLDTWRGEDYYFMAKAKALGFDAHLDQDLSKGVTHLGVFGYNPMMAELLGEKK